jgi:serine protease Do
MMNPSDKLFLLALALSVAGGIFFLVAPLLSQSRESDSLRDEMTRLEGRVAELGSQLQTISDMSEDAAPKVGASHRVDLTDTIARASPSVVSIIVTKDTQKLEVSYENPLGGSSFLKFLGIEVPVYRTRSSVKERVGAGSGFIVSEDGYIITNKHVVDSAGAHYTAVLSNGTKMNADVVYEDDVRDVAVLKIEGSYEPLDFRDSSTLKLGESVVAIGNALGEYDNSVSVGIISGLNRKVAASDAEGNLERLSGVIQTDAAINLGNSGGPLLDMSGHVVGINVATVYGSNNVSFAIPSNTVRSIVEKITAQ